MTGSSPFPGPRLVAGARRGPSLRAWLPVLLVGLVAAACGSDEPEPGNGTSPPSGCPRDLALLDDDRACVLDEDCPCGSSCELGACVYECIDNGACASDQVCSDFGRCVPADLANLPKARLAGRRGELGVDRIRVQLLEPGDEAQVRIRVRHQPVSPVRVVGKEVEVACGPDAEFGPRCTLETVAPDEPPRSVRIRRLEPWPDSGLRAEVVVYGIGQRIRIGVQLPGTPPPPRTVRSGVYEGVARLVGAGLKARTVQDVLPDSLQQLELPVSFEVFEESGGAFAVRPMEDRGAVFAENSVGVLSLDAARRWSLEVSSRLMLGTAQPTDPRDLQVAVSGRMEDASFRDGLLDGEYVATLQGLGAPGQEPFLRWRISARRVADLPADARPPGDAPGPDLDAAGRAATPFPEETAAFRDLNGLENLNDSLETGIAALCSPENGGLVTGLASTLDPKGDLTCSGGGPMRAFGLEQGSLRGRADFLASCQAQLEPAAQPVLGDATPDDVCLDRTRLVAALAQASTADRERGFGSGTPDLPASRITLRLVQQWVNLQAFVGLEPRRVHRVAVVAPSGPELQALSAYASSDAALQGLRTSIQAWDLILHPRVAAALAAMPPEALAEPDYRADFGSSAQGGDPELGLPVSMLYTLTAQLDGLDGVLEDLRFGRAPEGREDALQAELAAFLPRSVVVFALAQGLYDAARSSGVPGWEPAWQTARIQYGVAVNRMLTSLELLEAGANPLGIDEIDLPLYRLGDQLGTGDRFAALSDSLLGREDRLDPAIAPTLVEQASASLTAARQSIRDLLDRDLAEALQATGTERRLEALNRRYGEQIASLCGDPNFDALRILEQADTIDPDTCFLAPGCGFAEADLRERLNVADLGYQVCVAAKLRQAYGDAVSTGQAELDRRIDAVGGGFTTESDFFSVDGLLSVVDGFANAYTGFSQPRVSLPDGVDAEVARQVESDCEAGRQLTLALRPSTVPPSCQVTDDCPVDYVCRSESATCEPSTDVAEPACFYGSLGELAVSMQAAGTDITIARSELEEFSERYDNAMRGCILLAQGNQAVEQAIASHNATMDQLGSAKLAADIAANTAAAARDAFSLSSPYSAFGSILFGAAESAAQSTSDTIGFRMEQAERAHELTLEQVENEAEERICYNEAEAELVGARTAALRVRRQSQELARYFVEFQNLKISLGALLAEGTASLANEAERRVSPAQLDYWLDQNLEQLDVRMRRARRALYLAVLAVEYEYQFTSVERENVLAATLPSDLQTVLGRLRDELRQGTPRGGGNPTELLTVLSLRRNLLQLADRSQGETRRHALSETERFRRILVAPQFAVHDEDGRYLGQEIPFTIQPFGTLRLGDTGAIPLLSGLNCAERLWSVNATLIGNDLMNRTDTSIVTLQLRKRNTFSSQWCDERTGSEAQVATTRPSRNLFVDPFSARSWDEDATLSDLTDTREITAFSQATVQARINVERAELEREAFSDGDSTALAGRGVFGDYTLFIPGTTQSIDGSAGLRLENVEDVLIRLDYVAAESR